MILTLKIKKQSSCMTLWLMMMHQTIKFGNKVFGSLVGIIWTTLTFWPFAVTLTLIAVFQFFSQDTLAYDGVSSDQVWLPRNQQFRRYSRKSYFDHMSPCCDLDLENRNQFFFHMTLWLIMLHHHTKFGNKTFCSSGDIIWTNIQWHFELLLWPWPWMQ